MPRRLVLLLSLTSLACARRHSPAAAFTPPDSTSYQLCENQARCPAGSYCQGGVCDADCRADEDCPAGQTCNSRGQCGSAPAPTAASPQASGRLSVSSTNVALSAGQATASLRVENTGTADIGTFHALSDNPAVTVTPANGALPVGQGVDAQITVKPGWSGQATVRVLSSGGTSITSVCAQPGLAGYLRGTVDVTGPFLLGAADLALDVTADQKGNLSGVIDGQAALLWPFPAAVAITDDGQHTVLTFTLVGEPGGDGNPAFGNDVQREVTLSGTHVGNGPLSGTYQEVVKGLGSATVTVSGTFHLTHVGPTHGLVSQGTSVFQPATTPRPLPPSACWTSDCPSAIDARADWYFAQAFPFEQWSAGSSIVNGQCLLSASLAPGPCVSPVDELPAVEAFHQTSAPENIWEVFRAEASEALLQANDVIAQTIEPANAAYQGAAVDAANLESALGLLQQGLHENGGAGGLLAANNLWLAQQLVPTSSTRDLALDDLHRFGGIVRTELFAGAQRLDRLQRSGQPASYTARVAQQQATMAFLDAAALATVSLDGNVQAQAQPQASGSGALLDTAVQFTSVAAAFDQVERGLNPVGYPSGYIPFDYDPQQPTEDVFQQMAAVASQQLGTAAALESQLAQSDRDFEASSASLQKAVEGVSAEAQTQVVSLCGAGVDPNTGRGCGSGGKIGQDFANLQAVAAAVTASQVRAANDSQKLQMLEQQLQQEMGSQSAEMFAIRADGQTIAMVAQAKAQEEIENQDQACADSVVSAIGGFLGAILNPFAAIGALLQGGANADQQCMAAQNDQNDANLAWASGIAQTDETLQVQMEGNLVQDNSMLTQIFDALADLGQAGVDLQQQMSLLAASQVGLQSDFANLQQALATAQSSNQLEATNVDPTFRLFADQTGMRYAEQLGIARTWIFLATRALEYTQNQSFANAGEVFAAADANELTTYLSKLSSTYAAQQLEGEAQDMDDIVSLRNDILGLTAPVKDQVTGQLLSPAQQFQAFLALPKNLDENGNLALAFSTQSASGGGALFNPDVCQDRIADIKANLVSSALTGQTAYVALTQKGQSTLVECGSAATAKNYNLSSKTALITAGLNLPRSAENDPSYPANTDLFERPVLASTWVLSIDLHGNPSNRWVDLSQLDDIELWIHHRALTVQGQ